MKKIIFLPLILTGMLFSLFIVNLILFALVPAYHDTLSEAVLGKSDDIPTVIVNQKNNITTTDQKAIVDSSVYVIDYEESEVPLSPSFDWTNESAASTDAASDKKPEIVEKTYHEDCGTGKGYWVIKYSDGSYGIE
jgi:hypothetical protein